MPSVTDIDSDTALIVRGVLRLARRMRAETRSGAISGGALGLLNTLHGAGPMPAAALAAEQGLAPQSLTRLLQRLEAAAMIERAPDSEDRRNKIITITEHGRRSLGQAMRARRAWLTEAMGERLTDAEREQLIVAAGLLLRLAI